MPGGRMGLGSLFGRFASGASESLSLVAPADDVASARPLKPSSRVVADVRPWDRLDMSPSLINCIATSLSSSDMQLPTVGSGVGRIPETLPFGVEPYELLDDGSPSWRRRDPCAGVAYKPGCPKPLL